MTRSRCVIARPLAAARSHIDVSDPLERRVVEPAMRDDLQLARGAVVELNAAKIGALKLNCGVKRLPQDQRQLGSTQQTGALKSCSRSMAARSEACSACNSCSASSARRRAVMSTNVNTTPPMRSSADR